MLRLYYVILISLPIVLYYIARSRYVTRHIENYSEQERYGMVRRMIAVMKHNGRIVTDVYGEENLPQEGGYVMYSNHQGKYDVLGIISAHRNPCTFVIDEKRSHLLFTQEITDLLQGSRLDKTSVRQQAKTILDVTRQVKEGRRFIIFPEGGYEENQKNQVTEFLSGTFKCSTRSQTPIIPVAIKDSYKVFGLNSLRKVRTEVHFLPPLYYEEYGELSTAQIAQIVKSRIVSALGSEESCAS